MSAQKQNQLFDTTTTTTIVCNGSDGQQQQQPQQQQQQLSLSDRYTKAIGMIESSPECAIQELTDIRRRIISSVSSLFSSNESIYEISTNSIPFVAIEHYLAMSYIYLPTNGISELNIRERNLHVACHLFIEFLNRLDQMIDSDDNNNTNRTSTNSSSSSSSTGPVIQITFTREEKQQYEDLVQLTTQYENSDYNNSINNNDNDPDNSMQQQQQESSSMYLLPPPINRDTKIARFRMKQQLENERKRLNSLYERRKRVFGIEGGGGVSSSSTSCDEVLDGYDEDTLSRELAYTVLQMCKLDAFEEWMNILRELPMIRTMVRQQQNNQNESTYRTGGGGGSRNHHHPQQHQYHPDGNNSRSTSTTRGPLQVTHITQDSTTGLLNIRKEEIRAGVFRPSWNQPTMSLEELGQREYEAAIEREQRQKDSELASQHKPKRYDQLVKDGNEDNIDLVEASAVLDRTWDDWKDENPRGSGNKRGDVGDRNF